MTNQPFSKTAKAEIIAEASSHMKAAKASFEKLPKGHIPGWMVEELDRMIPACDEEVDYLKGIERGDS